MKPLDKALADIEASSRNNATSTSIKFGTWVGYGACSQIVKTLHEDMLDDFESRVCENCHWWTCYEGADICTNFLFACNKDFGCVKFEVKK